MQESAVKLVGGRGGSLIPAVPQDRDVPGLTSPLVTSSTFRSSSCLLIPCGDEYSTIWSESSPFQLRRCDDCASGTAEQAGICRLLLFAATLRFRLCVYIGDVSDAEVDPPRILYLPSLQGRFAVVSDVAETAVERCRQPGRQCELKGEHVRSLPQLLSVTTILVPIQVLVVEEISFLRTKFRFGNLFGGFLCFVRRGWYFFAPLNPTLSCFNFPLFIRYWCNFCVVSLVLCCLPVRPEHSHKPHR